MKVMLLIAHGSRKQEANDEIRSLAGRIETLSGEQFSAVRAAFLEMAEPDIRQGIEACAALGASEIVAVPYFLAAGRHVIADVPGEIESARAEFPGIEIRISQYLGQHADLPELVLRCADQSA